MTGNGLVGSLLATAGAVFLLLGLLMAGFGLAFLDRLDLAMLTLNGVCGASLATAGAGRMATWSRRRLTALWLALLLLVYATSLFGSAFVVLDLVVRGTGLAGRPGAWDARLVLLLLLLAAAVAFLLARWLRTGPATAMLRAALGALSYPALAVVGLAAWFMAPIHASPLLGLSSEQAVPLALMALGTSPIGLVWGILVAIWANAPKAGTSRIRRYGLAIVFVLAAPAVLAATLVVAGR